MTINIFSARLDDERATSRLAKTMADVCAAGDIVALTGDLGAGKSTFARAFIRARMQDDHLDVPSPTFTLVQTYKSEDGPAILHADLYRLSGPEDVEDLGLYDEVENAVLLVEWPDRMPREWREAALQIEFSLTLPETSRLVQIKAKDIVWQKRLSEIFS